MIFARKSSYREHARQLHNLAVRPKAKPNPNIIPYVADVKNTHCASCDIGYSTRVSYIRHLKKVHSLKPSARPIHGYKVHPNPNIKPDTSDPNNVYCKSCDRLYATKSKYYEYLRKIHKDIVIAPRTVLPKMNPKIQPDIDDCNNFCKSCNFTYNKAAYREHFRRSHKMQLSPVPIRIKSEEEKEGNDIRSIHNMRLRNTRSSSSS